jgi:diguanylate cyclase (GGDEF)-like protein
MTMLNPAATESASGRDVSGLLNYCVLDYLQTYAPAGTVQRVLQAAGESRPIDAMREASGWSTYDQFRRLLEATSAALQEPLACIGRHVHESEDSADLAGMLASLGSVEAVLEALPAMVNASTPCLQMRTTCVDANEYLIELMFEEGFDPYPEFCSLQMGLAAALPATFGFSGAEVVVQSCQAEGAPSCRGLLRWHPLDETGTELGQARLVAQVAQGRLEELQETVADLVSGDGLVTVLERVVKAVARSVKYSSFALDIAPSRTTPQILCTEGMDDDEARQMIARVREDPAIATLAHVCLVEVASDHGHYGYLHASRAESGVFEPFERSVLQSYARLAASALDSESAIIDARQQTSTAQALLALSSSLADLASTDELVIRIAHAVPSIVPCDRVMLWLVDAPHLPARVVATFGFDDDTESALHALEVTAQPSRFSLTHAYRHSSSGEPGLSTTLAESGSLAALSYPISFGVEQYGWITVDVTTHAERFDDEADITERLRGLAGQAAIAIRNSRLVDEIRHQALHDSLTGLPNRLLVLDRVEQALARARRGHIDLALLFIDLDGFKEINDTLGHVIGDRVLQAVSARLTGTLRASDTVARLGGDEFVVLAEGASAAGGVDLMAERLLGALLEPFTFEDHHDVSVRVSASIGVAVGQRDTAEELLRDADVALYAAKKAGRDQYIVFAPEMHEQAHDRRELEKNLQDALGTDQFFLMYQPIYDLNQMQMVGVEALLRWQHPTRGLLQPDQFIPILETSTLIVPVGRWVLEEACRQAMVWRADGQETTMSVNVSGRQLDTNSLYDDVRRALTLTALPAEALMIEITETSLMHNTKRTQKQLEAIKSLGVRIAIDDFGTGYSSLAYLQQFPVDCLKIDRSFISGMAKSPEGDALLHTLMQLGKALHLETVAEGIEEHSQLTQLQTEECDVGQGFLFARPLLPDEVPVAFSAMRTPVGSY